MALCPGLPWVSRYQKGKKSWILLKQETVSSSGITHTRPFNGPFSGTTQVSRYQKSKTNLDFTEARDSEWQWNQLGHMQVCTSLQTDNHASTPPLSFLQAGCSSCRPTNSVKALKAVASVREISDLAFPGKNGKSAARSRQITTPAPHRSFFSQAGCTSCRPTNSVKALNQ